MSTAQPLQVAVVGSGPSGCFLAQAHNRKRPEDHITIFDQLAAPYGLIRYGVASDHQQTKAITRQFDRLFAKDNIQFAGNIEIGAEITLDHLREHYDVVVMATGRPNARQLEVEGQQLDGVFTSGDIIYVLNSFHGETEAFNKLGENVVLVGGGNVALDILRFLIKEQDDYAGSDVNDEALAAYLASPVKTVTVLNRSTIDEAKSDAAMLKELGTIAGVRFTTNHQSDTDTEAKSPAARRRRQTIEELVAQDVLDPRVTVHFQFESTPTRFIGDQHLTGVEVMDVSSNQTRTIDADSVVTAVGFDVDDASPIYKGYEHLMAPNDESGRLEPGLYRTGWLKRGAVGTIPANRACAQDVAKEILEDIDADHVSPSDKTGFAGIQSFTANPPITFQQWNIADEHERNRATDNRIRNKFIGQQGIIEHASTTNA